MTGVPAGMDAAPGTLPAGMRVYAIGDVHGCAARLAALHRRIRADLAASPVARPVVVHLGDYIDRGPDSAAVLELLADPACLPGLARVELLGNHEAALLAALDGDSAAATDWLTGGGVASLESWGIAPGTPPQAWAGLIPARHVAWMRGLALSHRLGGYFFAHAGVRPGVPLAAQTAADLLGIRHAFLSSEADFGAVVVHGHTPQFDPVIRPNRIGIDTAAVFGGKLTCLILEGAGLAFLQE